MRATRQLPVPRADRPTYDQAMAAIRAALSEQAFEAAFADGQTLTQDEAVALALHETNIA